MSRVLLVLLILTLPLSAKPRHPLPKATPAPAVAVAPEPLPAPAPPAYVKQLTAEEDAQLKLWITGIMKAGDEAQAEVTGLKVSLDDAKGNLVTLQTSLVSTQTDLIGSQKALIQLDKDIAALKQWGIEQQARADTAEAQVVKDKVQLARFGKLVTLLSLVAALAAALYVFEMLKPAGILGKLLSVTGPAVQYGAPIVVFLIVFGAVQVYLRYLF